ncbi:MAG: GNAT family N-acetyltransferase [Bacilli bacterium]|nr:GNAT family N-acetyltransferase [Bacilli bacterium]
MEKRSNNITIRSFSECDISKKVEIINNSSNNKFLHYDLPLQYEKTLSWFNKIKDNNNRLDLTILLDNTIVGFIGLLGIDNINKKAEYYICVDSQFNGKGIGTTSSLLLLDYAFNELSLEKVYLFTEEQNIKAQHLFEKIGFVKEGLLRNDIIYNNRIINRFSYSILKGEYNERNTNSKNK